MQKVTGKQIIDVMEGLIQYVSGPQGLEIEGPDYPGTEKSNRIVFISSEEAFEQALQSKAICLVVPNTHIEMAQKFVDESKLLLASKNVVLAMSKVNSHFFSPYINRKPFDQKVSIHPTAVIHESAELGKGVIVGPNSVIGANCKLGNNTVIGSNTTIEPGVHIGQDSHIHSQVFIGFNCQLGQRVEIHPQTCIGSEGFGYVKDESGLNHRIPHYGRVIIEDDVHIGANFSIDRGTYGDTTIGAGSKIDNHGHIAHNNKVGKNATITAGFIVAGSTKIGDNYLTGGRVTMAGHIQVSKDVQTAALSVITKSITEPGNYAGYPLQNHKDAIRSQALLARLPEIKKTLGQIKKKLDK